MKLMKGDFVRYKSANILVITKERGSGSYDTKSLMVGKDLESVIRSSEELEKVTKINISICPECLKFIDKLHSDITKCELCGSYLHRSHKKHECLDSYPIPTLTKLNSLLDEIGLNTLPEFSGLEGSSLNAGALMQQTLKDENFASSFLVEIDKIIPGKQVRFSLNPEHVVKLQELIKTQGQLNPIIVFKVDNNYQIDDGHHRFEAIKNLEWKRINVIEIEKPENDIAELLSSYQSNMVHLSFSKLERGIALKILFEEMKKIDPEYSLNKFATELVKEPYTTVREAIVIGSLHPRVHELIEDEEKPLSKKAAYKLKVMTLDEQERFLDKFDNSIHIYQLNRWVEYWDRFTEEEKENAFEENNMIGSLHEKYHTIALEEKYDSICDKIDAAFDVKIEYELDGSEYQIRTSITSSLMNNLDIELFNGTKDIIVDFQRSTNKSVSKFIKSLKTQIEKNKSILEDIKKIREQMDKYVIRLKELTNFSTHHLYKNSPTYDYASGLLECVLDDRDENYIKISEAEGLERCNLLNIELSRQIKLYELKNKLTEKVNQIKIEQDQGEYGDRRDAILKLIESPELDENDILDKIDNLKKDLLFIDIFSRGINLRSNARNYLKDNLDFQKEVDGVFSPDEFNSAQFSLDELITLDKQLTTLEEKLASLIATDIVSEANTEKFYLFSGYATLDDVSFDTYEEAEEYAHANKSRFSQSEKNGKWEPNFSAISAKTIDEAIAINKQIMDNSIEERTPSYLEEIKDEVQDIEIPAIIKENKKISKLIKKINAMEDTESNYSDRSKINQDLAEFTASLYEKERDEVISYLKSVLINEDDYLYWLRGFPFKVEKSSDFNSEEDISEIDDIIELDSIHFINLKYIKGKISVLKSINENIHSTINLFFNTHVINSFEVFRNICDSYLEYQSSGKLYSKPKNKRIYKVYKYKLVELSTGIESDELSSKYYQDNYEHYLDYDILSSLSSHSIHFELLIAPDYKTQKVQLIPNIVYSSDYNIQSFSGTFEEVYY